MSFDASSTPHSPAGRLGILLGLTGLATGVVATLTGIGAIGLGAGVLALVGPTVMLREMNLIRNNHEHAGDPAPIESPEVEPTAVPFHRDSELLKAKYFDVAVKNRMTAARRFLKPLAIVQIRVTGEAPIETLEAQATAAVQETLRDCDTACVLGSGHIALVLEDTPENGAIWAVERIRRTLIDTDDSLTVWAGVACYPAHGMDTAEVMAQCEDALDRAQAWPQDRIEVAFAD